MPTGHYERPEPFERFLRNVRASDANACWEWRGSRSPQGYAQMRLNGKCGLAHRFIATEAFGEIPAGLVVDHLCRNRGCVNPAHLELVTMGENTRRGDAVKALKESRAARTHCARGHAFSGENLHVDARGHRGCKACQRMMGNRWRREHRERVLEMQRVRRAAGRA